MPGKEFNIAGYIGFFLVALSTLMFETLLTRIFSVTMWYHFAFMAVSIAMFGMTFGAIIIFLNPSKFTVDSAGKQMCLSSIGFAVTGVMALLTHLSVPFSVENLVDLKYSLISVYSAFLTFGVLSIPFVFSGICVCVALTRFPGNVSRLYSADLIGAAAGCFALTGTLKVMDALTSVLLACALAGVGSLLLSLNFRLRKIAVASGVIIISLCGLIALNLLSAARGNLPPLRLQWVKGNIEKPALFEEWNSYSRVRVEGDKEAFSKPFGWGLSKTYPESKLIKQLMMNIDATAATPITFFSGNPDEIDFLKYDVTSLAHYLRQPVSVLVIGAGGGRDILAALAFKQKSVTGVEMNEAVIKAVNEKYGDFSGHLDRINGVAIVRDEARSFIARSKEQFGIIQMSLVDTWAATSAGAYVLSENLLYTVEAWDDFLKHLSNSGIFTVSRWFFSKRPAEIYRSVTLAVSSLCRMGVRQPRKHIMVVRAEFSGMRNTPDGIGTIMVSPSPFSSDDIDKIKKLSLELNFGTVLTPEFAIDDVFNAITSGCNFSEFVKSFPIDISPPTDDRPFFFHMLKLRSLFDENQRQQGATSVNMSAVSLLGILFILVVLMSVCCIILPVIIAMKKQNINFDGAFPSSVYFASIGLGFMIVEITWMQYLMVFLGHPVYSLSVVLATLLLSSGVGSFLTEKINMEGGVKHIYRPFGVLIFLLIVFLPASQPVLNFFRGSETLVRIIISIVLLIFPSMFMGIAFPAGMKIANRTLPSVTPWLWGINGAMSVCASVISVTISMWAGISISYYTGVFCYVLAGISLGFMMRNCNFPVKLHQ